MIEARFGQPSKRDTNTLKRGIEMSVRPSGIYSASTHGSGGLYALGRAPWGIPMGTSTRTMRSTRTITL